MEGLGASDALSMSVSVHSSDVSHIGVGVHGIVVGRCSVEESVVAAKETVWKSTVDLLKTDAVIVGRHGTRPIEEQQPMVSQRSDDHVLTVIQKNHIACAVEKRC